MSREPIPQNTGQEARDDMNWMAVHQLVHRGTILHKPCLQSVGAYLHKYNLHTHGTRVAISSGGGRVAYHPLGDLSAWISGHLHSRNTASVQLNKLNG